jgi:hypothetical protein
LRFGYPTQAKERLEWGTQHFSTPRKKKNPRLRFVRSHISKSRCGAPFDLLLRKSFNLPSFVTPGEVLPLGLALALLVL